MVCNNYQIKLNLGLHSTSRLDNPRAVSDLATFAGRRIITATTAWETSTAFHLCGRLVVEVVLALRIVISIDKHPLAFVHKGDIRQW